MGPSFRNVASIICLICVLFVTFTIGQDDMDEFNSKAQRKRKIDRTDRRPDGSTCTCPACMTGEKCSVSVKTREPKFSNIFTFVEVNVAHHTDGVPLLYNRTTYPGDEQCPCDVFEYSIASVENVMEPNNPDSLNLFDIDSKTGKIRLARNRTRDITFSDLYRLKILVRNMDTGLSDHTMITVAREKTGHDDMYPFKAENGQGNGYELEEHSIHKRSVVPTEINFTLQIESSGLVDGLIKVGSRIWFRLDIVFPGTDTDISVELFTPDNLTTVMILCDVNVTAKGSNLGTSSPGNIEYSSKDGFDVYDMATLDFGTVTNSETDTTNIDESTITIVYSAVMIENPLTENTTYYISAGAEYLSAMYIWVGHASFEASNDGDQTTTLAPEFSVTMPSSIALGASHLIDVDMFIPFPYRDYVFKVLTPPNSVGLMSVCGIWFNEWGPNFGCGNNDSQISSSLEDDLQAAGNAIGVLNLGPLLNEASREASMVQSDNRVALTLIAHMYPDATKVGDLLSLVLALEIDNSQTMYIGGSNFTVDPEVTTGLTSPSFNPVSSSLNSNLDNAVIGQPFTLTYEMQVPLPVTTNVASHYILELLAPFDGTPIFSVCSFEVISVGRNFPCVKLADLVTEYSSRVNDSTPLEPDRATIDLGFLTNLDLFALAADDLITIEAILMPLASHGSATVGSPHTVSLGVTVGGNSAHLVDSLVTIGDETDVLAVTNDTRPTFTMSFDDGTDTVPVTGSKMVVVDMVTTRNSTYDVMNMEFLMPVGTEYSYFHVCRVDIDFNGRNMPCMTPEWYAKMVEYSSQFGNYEMDLARMNIGSMCNLEFIDDSAEDLTTFAVYLKVLDREDLTDMTSKWTSVGLQYSSTKLWVGKLKLTATRGTTVTPTKPTYLIITRNTTTSPIPLGLTVSYSMLIKIGRGDTAHLVVKATALHEGAHICTVRVFSAGSNLPCVVDEVVSRTITNWPSGSGRQVVELDLGVITNYGSTDVNMTANNYFDADSMIVEVLVRANPDEPAGIHSVKIDVFYDTDRLETSTQTMTDFITNEDTNTTVTDTVSVTVGVGEITGDSDNTTNAAIEEAKRVLITAVIPEESSYDLEFSFIIPSADVGKAEICDAAIVSVGDNLPCIDVLTEASFSSPDGVFTDSASFNLGLVCNRVLRRGDVKANTVVFEAYVRVLDNGKVAPGETVTVTASLRTFSDTVDIDSVVFNVEDPSNFVDRVSSLGGVTNDTFITLNQASPIMMTIGQNVTVEANITVPKLTVSRFLFDVDLPVEDSACLTITDIRIIGSVGRNVLCVPPDGNSKDVFYTPAYNSSNGNSQIDYVYIDIGIVINTGLTYRRNTYSAGDDYITIEFDIQMADCASSVHGHDYKLSIGNKVSDFIFIYDFDVEVVRDGNEKPDIVLNMAIGADSSSTVIVLEGTAFHTDLSTAEGKNTSFLACFPGYQQLAPGSVQLTSNQTCQINRSPLLQIYCEDFFFTDILTFTAELTLDFSRILPVGYSAWDSTLHGWVGTNYVVRSNTYDAEEWFPYLISSENELSYGVDGGIDTSSLVALGLGDRNIVADCQITSSSGNSGLAENARLDNAGAWVPFVRKEPFASHRYLVVYFGNQHKFSKIAIQQDEVNADLVTEVTVEYTNDMRSWFGAEVVSLQPSTLENKTLSGRSARGVKVILTDDTNNGTYADVGVKFEFYGEKLVSDVSQTEACATLLDSSPQTPQGYPSFGPRSFVEVSGTVFVCDRQAGSKMNKGHCKKSADSGTTWTKLDNKLACMLGYEVDKSRLYAFPQNPETIMMSEADGPWQSVPLNVFQNDQLLSTWTSAKLVPELEDAELDRPFPHSAYRIDKWGATMYGMYCENVIKMEWAEGV